MEKTFNVNKWTKLVFRQIHTFVNYTTPKKAFDYDITPKKIIFLVQLNANNNNFLKLSRYLKPK